MNRQFKTEFHNGELDEKTIVSMSVTVTNGKRFKALTNECKDHLIKNLQTFQKQVQVFTEEIEASKEVSNG